MKKINKAFYTDGMTVREILSLGDEILNSLKKRDLSRALRTVALAANKRIARLQQYVRKKKEHGKFIEKKNSPGLDLTALNYTKGKKFSVGSKNRNEIYQEFARARSFMNMQTSTIKGAVEVRKNKDRALLGQTREELTADMDEEEKNETIRNIKELADDIYDTYNDYIDMYGMKGGYTKDGGREILQDISKAMREGHTAHEAMGIARKNDTERYEARQEAEQETEEDFWNSVNGEREEWENW